MYLRAPTTIYLLALAINTRIAGSCREGMEDEASHAMTVLADEAGGLVPEITQVREWP